MCSWSCHGFLFRRARGRGVGARTGRQGLPREQRLGEAVDAAHHFAAAPLAATAAAVLLCQASWQATRVV